MGDGTGMGRQGPCPGVLTQENCRKVTRSVEDAEIKTNVLKQNSALLEEKLRYLQQQLQDETPRRQEAELQELEQKLEAGLSRHGLGPATQPLGCSGPPGSPDEPPRPRGLASGGWGMGPRAGEGPVVSEQELQKVSAGLEELRVERSAVSVASLRSELEGLGPVKPILEELGRQFQSSRRVSDLSMNLDRGAQGSCTRCASQGQQLSTESLQQLLERALTPLVDEVKQRGLAPACPSCQRLHKKILPSPASPAAPTLLSPGAGAPGLGQTRQGRGPELHPSAGPRRSLTGQEPAADGQDEAGGEGGRSGLSTLENVLPSRSAQQPAT